MKQTSKLHTSTVPLHVYWFTETQPREREEKGGESDVKWSISFTFCVLASAPQKAILSPAFKKNGKITEKTQEGSNWIIGWKYHADVL